MHRKTLCVSAHKPLIACVQFSIWLMLRKISITCINFKITEEQLPELKRGQADRRTKRHTNPMENFSTLFERVKNIKPML